MKYKSEAREFKRKQLEALKASQGRLPAGNSTSKPASKPVKTASKPVKRSTRANHPLNEVVAPDKPNTCDFCSGTGRHEGLFKVDICASCNGCGFDISDPLKVIEYQAAQLKKGRRLYEKLGRQFADLMNRYGAQRYKDEELLKAVRGNDLKGRLD